MKRGHPGNRLRDSSRCKVRAKAGDIIDPAVAADTGQPGEVDTERPEGARPGGTRRSTNRQRRWTRRCGATRTFPVGTAGRCSTRGCPGRRQKRIWRRKVSGTLGAEQPETLKEMRGGETRNSIAG